MRMSVRSAKNQKTKSDPIFPIFPETASVPPLTHVTADSGDLEICHVSTSVNDSRDFDSVI